jgi:predicted RNase H-like HicB family nuclease
MTAQTYTAIIQRQNGHYAAECPEAGTNSVGATIEAALTNLRAATERDLHNVHLIEVDAPLVTTFAVGGIATSAMAGSEQRTEELAGQTIPMTGEALLASGLVGIWADRTDIGDTLEFARELRKQAEKREHE